VDCVCVFRSCAATHVSFYRVPCPLARYGATFLEQSALLLDRYRSADLSSLADFYVTQHLSVSKHHLTGSNFATNTPFRNRGYEFFKATHFFAVVVFMVTFFWHCDHTLTSWHYFVATAAVYVPCFVYPWLRTVFEYKWSQRAEVSVEENGFIRITIPAMFHWTPGQHCFLRSTSFGVLPALTAHPFTICSSPLTMSGEANQLVFYIRHQGGFTDKLYQHALSKPDGSIPVIVDGPYGGVSWLRLRNADRLLVIAGGSGAGWTLPFIEHFIRSATTSNDESAPRIPYSNPASLRMVLATRDTQSRLWFEQAVQNILAQHPTATSSSVQIQVYLTGTAADQADLPPKTAQPTTRSVPSEASRDMAIDAEKEDDETAAPGKEYTGRPQLPLVVQEEAGKAADADQALNVYVCGPKTMQNDVRNAVAAENLKIISGARSGGVYLHTEHFSWA
jgi:NAD(P)H-flavin reductase